MEDEYPLADNDLNDPVEMDGETFKALLSEDEEFYDRFESGQPMGDWDH